MSEENTEVRAAEFRVKVLNDLKNINSKIDDIKGSISENATAISNHVNYHNENEHLWGIYTLLQKKPLWTLVMGSIVTAVLIKAGVDLVELFNAIIRKF